MEPPQCPPPPSGPKRHSRYLAPGSQDQLRRRAWMAIKVRDTFLDGHAMYQLGCQGRPPFCAVRCRGGSGSGLQHPEVLRTGLAEWGLFIRPSTNERTSSVRSPRDLVPLRSPVGGKRHCGMGGFAARSGCPMQVFGIPERGVGPVIGPGGAHTVIFELVPCLRKYFRSRPLRVRPPSPPSRSSGGAISTRKGSKTTWLRSETLARFKPPIEESQ